MVGSPSISSRTKRRADFVTKVIGREKGTNVFTIQMTPDPRRYDEIVRDGEKWYRDKYLDEVVSLEDLAAAHRPGLPMYYLSASVRSTPAYASERRAALGKELRGGPYTAPAEIAKAHNQLNLTAGQRDIAFLSLDVCGSTALRASDAAAFDRAFALLLRELGTLVGQFNGAILKTTGDGFIAYVDHPAFTSQCDAVVDLGLSLLVVTSDTLNPVLASHGLPHLDIRVGADYGPATVIHLGIPATGFVTTEIASDALNRTVKIEQACGPNEFRIGRSLYELVHVQWLERASQAPFDGKAVGLAGYQTYRVS